MDNIKNKPSVLSESIKVESFNIIPQDVRQLPVGTKVKINCLYAYQSNEGIIVETPEGKSDKFGQWIDNGNYSAHYPYCRFEEVGEKTKKIIMEEKVEMIEDEKKDNLIIDLMKEKIVKNKEISSSLIIRKYKRKFPVYKRGGK